MLDLVAVFVEIVEAGTLTRAAARTGLAKSTLSRSLAALESRVGVRLLQRNARALKLTSAGERLYGEASDAVRALETAVREATSGTGDLRGRIRLSAPESFGRAFVGPLVARFLARHPHLQIEALFSDRRVELVADGFDLAFRLGDLADSTLVARDLMEVPRALVAAPHYLERFGAPATPADLAAHRLGAVTRETRSLRLHHPIETAVRVDLPAALLAAPEALLDAVAAGALIAPLPLFLAEAALRSGTLVEVLRPWYLPNAAARVVYPSAHGLAPAVRALIDTAVEAARQAAPCGRWQTGPTRG